MLPEAPSSALAKEFMLEEYKALESRFQGYRIEGVNRFNSYVTSTSVMIGGALILLANTATVPWRLVYTMVMLVMLVLSSIGIDAWNYIIVRQIESDRFERGLARIRRYFLHTLPTLEPYLVNKTHDEPTLYVTHQTHAHGIRRSIQTIQAVTTGFAGGLALSLLLTDTMILSAILGGIGLSLVDYVGLELLGQRRFRRAYHRAQATMQFPPPSEPSLHPHPTENAALSELGLQPARTQEQSGDTANQG